MPLKQGTANTIRLYKQLYVYYGTSSPGGIIAPVNEDPTGKVCTFGQSASYNGGYWTCDRIEVEHLKDTSNNDIHKRVVLTFDDNGGSSGNSTQTRTWDVENVTEPSDPTRSGYDFDGWATTSGASTPNVTFPFIAPQNDTTYYAVWTQQQAPTATPTIYAREALSMEFRVRNNDALSAAILADSSSPPSTYRGLISSDGYTSWISLGCAPGRCSRTIYATASASGKTVSAIRSLYFA